MQILTMSQQEQINTTSQSNKRTRRGKRSEGQKYGFLTMKESNIPVSEQVEDKNTNVIKWGKSNEYPYFLNYLYQNNPLHSGIINGKVYFITSGGLIYEGQDLATWQEIEKSFNLNKLPAKLSLDLEKSNSAYIKLEFITSALDGKRKIKSISHLPFEDVRKESVESPDGIILTGRIKVSNDWCDKNRPYYTLSRYDKDNPEQLECYICVEVNPGASLNDPTKAQVNPNVYPIPTYSGGITAIDTGIQIGLFNNSETYNGFSLGTILNLNNGAPKSNKEKDDLESDLGAATTGVYQAGRMMVLYNNGKEREASVVNLNGNNLPDRYLNVKKSAEESIIHAHSVTTPILFGIKQEGSLGNATELEIGYAIMQANYFEGRRDLLLEIYDELKNVLGLMGTFSFGEVVLNLPKEEAVPATTMNVNLNSEKEEKDIILERLKQYGTPKENFKELFSMPVGETPLDKESLISEAKKGFQNNLSKDQSRTLGLINGGNDFNSIRKALDISGNRLVNIYKELIQMELITSEGKLTTAGEQLAGLEEATSLRVVYQYDLRPEMKAAGDPLILPNNRTRPFCEQLISLNRVYTREEIDIISGMEGYNVFAYRGGWYHNPNTDTNEPGCRHSWLQIIVSQ